MTADSVEFVDLVALRPIRRKDGTKAVRMADGTFLEIVPVKFLCGDLENGKWKWAGEGHPSYLWRMGFVIALLKAGYKVLSAENYVLAVTKLRPTSPRSRNVAFSQWRSTCASRSTGPKQASARSPR